MLAKYLIIFAIMATPVSAQLARPGGDAGSALGRDAPAPPDRQPLRRVPVLTASPTSETVGVTLAENESVQIGAVHVEGLAELAQADFADIAERHIGASVDQSGLSALARAIADRARQRGYIFASAAVPAQQLNIGIVRVVLDEGAINEVRIAGSDNTRLRALLDALVGKAVRKADVERRLLLAGDLAGIQIASANFVREVGKGVLVVQAEDARERGFAVIDNYGSRAFGPFRMRLGTEHNGLLDETDQFTSYSTATVAQPSELTYIALRYTNLVSPGGLQLALTGAEGRTHDFDRATGFEAIGRSRSLSVALSAPLLRASSASLWLSGDVGYLTVRQDFLSAGRQRDDVASLAVSTWGNARLAGSRLHGGLTLTRGLGILGANAANDPLSSRLDASGQFTKLNAWMNWTGKLTGGLSMRVAATGQLASRPLLAPQEIGLGGPSFGRGYDFSERFGDQGALGLAELRRTFNQPTKWLGWAQFYGFFDGGYIDNLRGGFGGGTLVSGGGGVRAGSGRTELGVEVAAPINADRFESLDKSPKLNLVFTHGF